MNNQLIGQTIGPTINRVIYEAAINQGPILKEIVLRFFWLDYCGFIYFWHVTNDWGVDVICGGYICDGIHVILILSINPTNVYNIRFIII